MDRMVDRRVVGIVAAAALARMEKGAFAFSVGHSDSSAYVGATRILLNSRSWHGHVNISIYRKLEPAHSLRGTPEHSCEMA